MERKRKQQHDAEQWRNHITAQQESSRSITAYCRAAGISESGFYHWRKQLDLAKPRPGFERIDREAQLGAAVIITTPNGYQIQSERVETVIAVAQRLARC